jgi:hypothetical protein
MRNKGDLRVFFAACGLICLAACTDQYSSISHTETPWIIQGKLIFADSGKPVPNNRIELVRTQRACRFCEMSNIVLATTQSDSNGNFQIESDVPGVYDLITLNPNNSICTGQGHLGYLSSRTVRLRVKVKEHGCFIIL